MPIVLFIFLSLHMPQARGKSVAEIAHKFSFVDHPPPSSPSFTQREDALSAATSARLANVSSQGPVEDKLVQRSRLGSSSAHVESAPPPHPFPQVFVPPPPPPPPAFVPPPPPPPPVVAPTEHVILRRKLTKKDKDRKKRDSGGPQLSMAEVIAKAKKMREQRERVLSTGSGPTSSSKETTDDPFESAMQARVVQLKSRRVEVQQGPREEEDSELMREMRRKAQRASRAFVENEKTTHLSVEDSAFVAEVERRPSRDNSTSSREAGDNDSLHSLETSDKLESPKQVRDFVDSLFDPVLSQGVEGLSDEVALQGALKGGGGVNQPNTTATNASTATASTAVNGHPTGQPHTQGNGYPVHPAIQAQGNGYPGMMQTNGFPGMMPGAPMYYGMPQPNGPLVGLPQASNGPVMGGPLYPANMDTALLAAQQQVLIERLIAQQALLQQQQTVASQKQQEQLLMLAQQQQSQLEQLQHMLATNQPAASPLDTQGTVASSSASTSTATNGHVVSLNGETTAEVLSPPSEFSDIGQSSPPPLSPIPPPPSPLVLIPPRSTSLPPAPEPTISLQERSSLNTDALPPPPPPISDDSNAEENISIQRPDLTRRATDKVALFVAALEGKSGGEETRSPGPASPLKHGDSSSFSPTSPVRKESAAKERPEFHKRTSSSIGFVVLSDKQNNTVLHPRSTGPYLSYSHVKWKLNIRKEVSFILACKNWKINRDDHSSLSSRTAVQI